MTTLCINTETLHDIMAYERSQCEALETQLREYHVALLAKVAECDQLEADNERLSCAVIGMCRDYDAPLPNCVVAGSTGDF